MSYSYEINPLPSLPFSSAMEMHTYILDGCSEQIANVPSIPYHPSLSSVAIAIVLPLFSLILVRSEQIAQ